MVLVTSHGFSGAYLGSRHGVSMQRDRRRRHRDGDATTTTRRRCMRADLEAPEQIGRTAGERAVARLNPRKVSTRKVPVVFDPRVASSLVGHLAGAINGSADRAQDQLPQGQARRAAVRAGHQHHRRSAAPARAALAPVRRRGRCRPAHGADRRTACSRPGCSTARPRASSGSQTTGHAQRGASSTPSPGPDQPASGARRSQPRGADARTSPKASTSPS